MRGRDELRDALSYCCQLLVVGLAVRRLWLLAERRRARYAVRYTNLDVLASVVEQARVEPIRASRCSSRSRSRSLLVSLARPHVNRMVASERPR